MDAGEKLLSPRKLPSPLTLTLARRLWPLPAVLALLLLIAALPAAVQAAYSSWEVLRAYPAVSDLIPYRPFARYRLILRHLATLAFWLVGLFVYVHVGLRESRFSGGYYFWDPLTAALAVDESLGYIKEGKIWVSTASGTNSGLTRLLNQGCPARYAKWADADAFEADFLRTLNQP